MKAYELTSWLEKKYPASAAEDWDNVGLLTGDDTREISHIKGQQIAPDGVRMENPAFDVTPHQNVTAIITEKGVVYPPFDLSIPRLQGE